MMYTPVFLDQLPDISAASGRKPTLYRQSRNRALLDLLLNETVTWQERDCPACGQAKCQSRSFNQVLMPFQRCTGCNTIYAAQVPDQRVLDRLRLELAAPPSDEDSQSEEFKFISLLNWVKLTEARLGRKLQTALDYRFCSQAPGWQAAVNRLSRRHWSFLPLTEQSGAADYPDLSRQLQEISPQAVMILSEMDRVADPAQLLRCIRDNAPAGTLVFITTSCADGLEYEILGADSPSFIPLDRLTVFSVRGLESLARAQGFKILESSTPGRLDAVILEQYFKSAENSNIPFWSGFFRDANKDRLHDLQILLQRSLKSGVMRIALET